ncbi:polymorphic toxin type 44 domain-containing protein [Pseudomonas syringae]|uniref:Bacterial toxin 44 domain-containing protein n=1 Tax=Pseudomonas syringae TaxID=317 RepID=A0A085VFB7_PSESX|nr:polymorphic toxin type 44 domain-containing protein [Pseudomonas syringae]KFE54130.1 hypothetical protein IV01_17480 [Pseudomonas syringae]
MVRSTAQGIGKGLDGDKTTTGAVCITSLPEATNGGRGILRLGDVTTPCPKCGKAGEIVGNLMPTMKYNGIPVAMDGAEILCGCPPGSNRLEAPVEGPQVSRAMAAPIRPPATNAQPANPWVSDKIAASFNLPGSETQGVVCNHPDQLHEPARYIAEEMNRNLSHPVVSKIKTLLSYDPIEEQRQWLAQPWYSKIGRVPDFHGIALGKQAAAAVLWAKMVGQDQEWDHKPKLIIRFNGAAWHKYGRHTYFYDIWSNVHYGYIGVACGFSEDWLFDGAGLEQIGSDSVRKIKKWRERPGPRRSEGVEGWRAWDDPPDRISIAIGIKLYRRYSTGGLTSPILVEEVLAVPLADWGSAVEVHDCYKTKLAVT